MYCENGFKNDSNGCAMCECAKCPTIECAADCQYGYKLNDKGCATCECLLTEWANIPPNLVAFVVSVLSIALAFVLITAILMAIICHRTRRSRFYDVNNSMSSVNYDNDMYGKKQPQVDLKSVEQQKVSLA
jgi:hypothetical protein